MKFRSNFTSAAFAAALMMGALPSASHALTMQECSAKYEAAKTAGTLGDKKWNDFRKAECSADVSPAAATPAATPAAAPTVVPAAKTAEVKPAEPAPAAKDAVKPAAAPVVASTPAIFPAAITPKYASETPGKGRMHTCADQYKANKASNGNGGMKWIEKGGGYYSQCNARLKG